MILNIQDLENIASEIRFEVIEMSHRTGTPHLGSCLSVIDILVAVYFSGKLNLNPVSPNDPNRDRVILSKGHAAMALYSILCRRGYFNRKQLLTYAHEGSSLQEHPGPKSVPGIEIATGSLGHGLGVGLGMALAARTQNPGFRVVTILSDGECNEGSTWEAALFGSAQNLSRVTVFIDYNKWQATGRSNEVLKLAPLREKWAAFGWETLEIDGHNMASLVDVLENPESSTGKPCVIICNTVKGKGCSFMEDDNNWHYRIPSAEEVKLAKKELNIP